MKKMLACLLSFTILASTLTGCTVGASNATATAAENQAPAERTAIEFQRLGMSGVPGKARWIP